MPAALIRKIVQFISGKKQADGLLSGYVAKNSIRLFLMHGIALVLGFFSNYILIKVAGVDAYGAYIYIFNFIYLLGSCCLLGVDTLLVRKIAGYQADAAYARVKGLLIFTALLVAASSLIIPVVFQLLPAATYFIRTRFAGHWYLITAVALLLLSVIAVSQSSLQGLKKIVFSQLTEKILRPLLLILAVLLFFYFRGTISTQELVWMNVAVIGAGAVITSLLLGRSLPFAWRNIKAQYDTTWFSTSLSFFMVNILYMLNVRIDVFLLGLYKTGEDIGVYNIALRLSEVVSFGLVIINFVIAPIIAELYAAGNREALQAVITRSARAVLVAAFPLYLIIVFFRHPVLSFFDVDILQGHAALLILCTGQLLNVVLGSVGLLLTMTGHQRFSIMSLLTGTALNIGLNMVLVPAYGLMGTAIATASSLVLWNMLMYFFVRKKLGIRTTAFGVI